MIAGEEAIKTLSLRLRLSRSTWAEQLPLCQRLSLNLTVCRGPGRASSASWLSVASSAALPLALRAPILCRSSE